MANVRDQPDDQLGDEMLAVTQRDDHLGDEMVAVTSATTIWATRWWR